MGIDISQLGKDAQAQVMAKMAVPEVKKRSKYGNRKVVCDGIKFDSEREAARFGELKVLRAMGKIRDLRLQANFTLVDGYTTIEGERIKPMVYRADFVYERATDGLQRYGALAARGRGRKGRENEGLSTEKETDAGQVRHHDPRGVR